MSSNPSFAGNPKISAVLPEHRGLYYGGTWHEPHGGYAETFNPATGDSLGRCAQANAEDVHNAALEAHSAFREWRKTGPIERGDALRKIAHAIRVNAEELGLIDSADCGNPVSEAVADVHAAAKQVEYFAGLATEIKGETSMIGDRIVNATLREPFGVCARLIAYNHPLLFAAKFAPALVAGNTVILKPAVQSPLSAYRLMELIDGILPPGVLSVLTGGIECGQALVSHELVPKITLIGGAATGRAILAGGASRMKQIDMELGGKNAMIIFPDADLKQAVNGAVRGMNFTWCGQSCGSTSRLFIHESIWDQVVAGVIEGAKHYVPGIPTEKVTTMGSLVSKAHWDRVMNYIDIGKEEGATLRTGGQPPSDPKLSKGCFIEPTIFTDVTMNMRIAKEEIFGPVLSVFKWKDEDEMFEMVNGVEYGLTSAIFTASISNAYKAARRVEAGFVWVNNASAHFMGVPFGGVKQSGNAREESLSEVQSFTYVKNVSFNL